MFAFVILFFFGGGGRSQKKNFEVLDNILEGENKKTVRLIEIQSGGEGGEGGEGGGKKGGEGKVVVMS